MLGLRFPSLSDILIFFSIEVLGIWLVCFFVLYVTRVSSKYFHFGKTAKLLYTAELSSASILSFWIVWPIVDWLLAYVSVDRWCGGSQHIVCIQNLDSTLVTFFPILPLLIFSVAAYFQRKDIFRTWIRFAYWFIPLSMLLILISPNNGLAIEKDSVAFVISAAFAIVSIGIMVTHATSFRNLFQGKWPPSQFLSEKDL
ncbi:MAG: hypothetical protein WAN50_04340 [Minisyncoccia bacterium]